MTKTVDIENTEEKWADLIALAREGTEVILANEGEPLAHIVPIKVAQKKRIMGLHLGQTWMSDDFDAPMTEEFGFFQLTLRVGI